MRPQMLVHLQSFNSIPEHYTTPESTNGVPLFYIPPGSTAPVFSLQHSGSKDSSQSQFASYWKPVLSMDANFWQCWLHMHRCIAVILEHDTPVPKHVHNAGSIGSFSTIPCLVFFSHSALTSLLRDWSSLVLVEGYSYVRLIYSASELPPVSFYLVRLISKALCMVLRLGFPIGGCLEATHCVIMAVWFDSVCFWCGVSSFSTDDDSDTEVEAIDVDTELNLVTECWVEPQSGAVCSSLEQQRHFQKLTYQEIPQAISDIIVTDTYM
ncbi:KICSTOR complex protein SZT2-like [Cyprinus carpio]|uniref:KICSTOR complex protein SZT2-like n=1 Tax=Cyprinus carpio TaxID=7962 RepID=A0A9Q9WD09_CYPCA|nr:KICSTOR complex protein SZT2-like [Cyprinus carpio]